MFKRSLALPPPGTESFFLWGPRQTGKTTLLRAAYPDGFWIDLLKSEEFRRYSTRPESIREELAARRENKPVRVSTTGSAPTEARVDPPSLPWRP